MKKPKKKDETLNTNVGGYVNNSLDLIFNLIWAICAMTFILLRGDKLGLPRAIGLRPCSFLPNSNIL